MEETVKMVFAHTTRKGWKVYHGYTESGEEPLIRDIYFASDGQIESRKIEVTLTDEKKGISMFMTAGSPRSAIYKPAINPRDPLAKPSILVMYVNRRLELPLELHVSAKAVTSTEVL